MSGLIERARAIADDAMGMEPEDRHTISELIARVEALEGATLSFANDWRYSADDWAIGGNEHPFVARVEAIYQIAATEQEG